MVLLRKTKKISGSLLFSYCFLVFATTVLSRSSRNTASYDLRLFRVFQIEEWWEKHDLMLQIKANILMFVPIGFLLMQVGKSIKGKAMRLLYAVVSFITCILFSTLIEYLQYKLHRGYCEVDDIIHNTIGTVIGIALYWIIDFVVNRLKVRNIVHHMNN